MSLTEYEKAEIRSWSIEHALVRASAKQPSLAQLIRDAKQINAFIIDSPPAQVLKITEKGEADHG